MARSSSPSSHISTIGLNMVLNTFPSNGAVSITMLFSRSHLPEAIFSNRPLLSSVVRMNCMAIAFSGAPCPFRVVSTASIEPIGFSSGPVSQLPSLIMYIMSHLAPVNVRVLFVLIIDDLLPLCAPLLDAFRSRYSVSICDNLVWTLFFPLHSSHVFNATIQVFALTNAQ